MKQSLDEPCEYLQNGKYFVGPLNIDKQLRIVSTVMGSELNVSENEFDALDMLATRENEPLSFEQLYSALWDVGDGGNYRENARLELNQLTKKVNMAGNGFMWIEKTTDSSYIFHTRWSHNWNQASG